jgi:hypothetical protein
MLLLSENLTPSLPPGPIFAKADPVIGPDVLANSDHFVAGQPFDLYAPRHRLPGNTRDQGQGFWVLTRYDDVLKVDGDPQTFSSQKGGILMAHGPPESRHPLLFRASVDAMINMDAP